MFRLVCHLLVVLPQPIKHWVARRILKWDLHPTARIGFSLVSARKVTMGPDSIIGDMNTIRGLSELRMGVGTTISRGNLIVAPPVGTPVYAGFPNRYPALIMDDYSQITTRHNLDATDQITMGKHATIAGFGSTVLTHNLDLVRDRFVPGRVTIGDFGVLMSNCVMQNNTNIPHRSIISAGSVLSNRLTDEQTLYRGNPVVAVRRLPDTLKFFHRTGRQEQVKAQLAFARGEELSELDEL